MIRLFLAFSILLSSIYMAFADPKEDIDYIVSRTVTKEMFAASIESNRDMFTSAIIYDLSQRDITIGNPKRFFDIFIEEFIDEFTLNMQNETGAIYRKLFTDQELADLAAFYKTPTGKKLTKLSPVIIQEGSRIGAIAGAKAGENAGERVGRRLEKEGILINDDRSLTDRLIDALR